MGLTEDLLSLNLFCFTLQSSAYTESILMTIYKFTKAMKGKGKDL